MSYRFVGDEMYDRTTPVEMTQVNPEPVKPQPVGQADIEESSHITLHQAARDGNFEVIFQRLQKLGRLSSSARTSKLLNKCDEENTTPLHYAVRYGHVRVAKLLVEYGGAVDASGQDGATPLHYAARFRANKQRPSVSRHPSTDGVDGEINAVVAPLTHAISTSIGEEVNDLHRQVSTDDTDESLIHYLVLGQADINVEDHYGQTPLHYAATKGNVTAVKELLSCRNIKVDARDRSGSTALHCAAANNVVEIIQALLDAGADGRAKDNERMTPIHFACSEGNIETVQMLFAYAERSQDVYQMLEDRNREGETALHSAVEGGYLDVVKLCLEKGANVRSRRGNLAHPLHIASINGHVQIAGLLVSHNAKIDARNANHETPLHKAAAFNRTLMVDFLLGKGADMECRDKDKYTPLLTAAAEGHRGVVSMLLDKGANLKATDTHEKTAIFVAAEENSIETLKELLEHKDAALLINESDLYGNTPLHVAAMKGYASVTEVLIKHGARIDARDEDDNTPLHLASKCGRIRTILELLRKDPSIINDEDEASNTPLHLAAIEGHVKSCRTLLEHGAEVDARNSTLWTPLDCAAAKGHTKVASLLLEFDSPVDPTDKAKTTPLHLAAKEGHPDVVSLLLSKGADVTLVDHTGRNCLDLAIDHGRKEVAAVIIRDDNWMQAMRNKTKEQGCVTSPMRKLISKLPEVAEMAFNRCIKDNGRHLEDPNYEITLYYEFLEDIYSDWSDTGDGTASETSSQLSFSMEDTAETNDFQMIQGQAGSADAVSQLESKNNHPLMIMVKNKREQLLGHPLVTFLLDYKWRKFGRYIYYLRLSLYCIFLLFLTGYTVYVTEFSKFSDEKKKAEETSAPYVLWVEFGRIIILVLSSCQILFELFQLLYQFRQYMVWENLVEWGVFVLAIVYVADEFNVTFIDRNSTTKITIGALSIFLAWMALVLFIRKFPKLGIYVVMFTSIMYTFMKFFIIFLLFLVAFALAFHTLLHRQIAAFSEPGRSIVKTGVMMIGEFDFDNIFNSDVTVPEVTWVIFIVFLIIMTLLLMNLLIGLAVDDIKAVQEQAVLERQAMLVDLALDVEKALPRKIRKRLLPTKEVVCPNQGTGLMRFFFSPPISGREVRAALKPTKTSLEMLNDRTDQLQDTVTGLKNRIKTMQVHQDEIHSMLKGIVKKLEAIVEGDDDADEELF